MRREEEDGGWQDDWEDVWDPEADRRSFPHPFLERNIIFCSEGALRAALPEELEELVARHDRKDWGQSPREWVLANRIAVRTGGPVRSCYRLPNCRGLICVDTDAVCSRGYCRRRHLTHVYALDDEPTVRELTWGRRPRRA
jgi:hypothetical protein